MSGLCYTMLNGGTGVAGEVSVGFNNSYNYIYRLCMFVHLYGGGGVASEVKSLHVPSFVYSRCHSQSDPPSCPLCVQNWQHHPQVSV